MSIPASPSTELIEHIILFQRIRRISRQLQRLITQQIAYVGFCEARLQQDNSDHHAQLTLGAYRIYRQLNSLLSTLRSINRDLLNYHADHCSTPPAPQQLPNPYH